MASDMAAMSSPVRAAVAGALAGRACAGPGHRVFRRWLLILCALASTAAGPAAHAGEPAPVTLLYNAHVFTAEPDAPYAQAVAIQGQRILAVGALAAVERAAGPQARRVDLHGKFLMPGMIDAHAHPIWGGLTLVMPNFPDTNDAIPDLVAFVAGALDRKQGLLGDVLVVYGVDIGYWTQAAQIDAALSSGRFAQQAIVLFGSDGHTAWANRRARERAGITTAFLEALAPQERRYYGYDHAFVADGFLVDAGKTRIERSLPPYPAQTMLAAGRAAVHYFNGLGITAWLDAQAAGVVGGDLPLQAGDPGFLPVYRDLALRGELTAHVAAYPVIRPDSGISQLDEVQALQKQFAGITDLSIPGLKVFADGVVEFPSQTAALSRPYRNNGRLVAPLFQAAPFAALVTEADRRGLIVHIHAIGDEAVKESLDAFAAARQADPAGRLPHTLTHAQFVDPQDISRFAPLRVIAALQLLWAVADPSTNEVVKPYIDPGIYRTMYPARALLEAGTVIAGASDWPVSTADPFAAMYQAQVRDGPQGVLFADQRMPRLAMLYAYTRNAARVLDRADEIGSLAPGKRADLVLVDRDLLTVSTQEFKDAKVEWTMFGGRVVYGSGP